MKMSMQLTTTLDDTSEIRPLSETELEYVNGGFLPLLVAGTWLAAGFMWGMVAGDYLHEYYNS
jgi:lactobin A/cerein 7B family class IIb bacteriocin